MTISEILLLDFDPEMASTRRTLERIPENDPQWKPHDKSMAIGRLALHVARLPEFLTRILTSEELNFATEKFPDFIFQSTAHLVSEFERTSTEAKSHITAASDDELRKNWKLLYGDRVIVDGPRMVLYRTMFLNHIVHHRAQLGVYLRLLNIPVPGHYGPSADEPFS
ncbi:MAG: DinB family protein [Bryobacteraceae bacterium]